MIIFITQVLSFDIICNDTICSANFQVSVTDILDPSKVPNNPCIGLKGTAGYITPDFTNRLVCNCTTSFTGINTATMTFNVLFGGNGNFSYYMPATIPAGGQTAQVTLQLDTSTYSGAAIPSVDLTPPAVPTLFRYCQDLGKTNVTDYSALFNGSGGCKPVNSSFSQTQNTQTFTFTATSCFGQPLSVTGQIQSSQVSIPITLLSSQTQQCSASGTQCEILGDFQRIFNMTANIVPTRLGNNDPLTPTTQNVTQLNKQNIVLQPLQLGEYNLTFDYNDDCEMRYYQRLRMQLLSLTYVQVNASMNVVCSQATDLCTSSFTLPGMQQFATSNDVCNALQIMHTDGTIIRFSQFLCTFNPVTQQVSINFTNTSFTNMSFSMQNGSVINEETTNLIRLNRTQLSYLNTFDVTVGTVTANYVFNTSRLYCGLTSYSQITTGNQNFITINTYGCGNQIQTSSSSPLNDSLTSMNFTLIYMPCFGSQVTSQVEVFLRPYQVDFTPPTGQINFFDTISVFVTFFDDQAGAPIYQPPTTRVFLWEQTSNRSIGPISSMQLSTSSYRFDFNVPVTGDWYFNVTDALDRCIKTLTHRSGVLLGNIQVLLTYFFDGTADLVCIAPTVANSNYINIFLNDQVLQNYTYSIQIPNDQIYQNLRDVLTQSVPMGTAVSQAFDAPNDSLGSSTCSYDSTTMTFTLTLKNPFSFQKKAIGTETTYLCFKTTLVDANGATLNPPVCLRLADPVLDCAKYYNSTLDFCTARNPPPINIFSENTTTKQQLANGSQLLNINLVDRFGVQLTNQFSFLTIITITQISIVPVYNCTITCDQTIWLNVSLNYSSNITIKRVYLSSASGAQTADLQKQNNTFWASLYYTLNITGTVELRIDYTDQCAQTETLRTTYMTEIIRRATYVFSDQLVYLNSFTYYQIAPPGFVFSFENLTSQPTTIPTEGGTPQYATIPNQSNATTLAIMLRNDPTVSAASCLIYVTIVAPEVNGTVWSRSSSGCDFADQNKDAGTVGQRLLVPLPVSGPTGLLGDTATLTVVIVATAAPARCELVQALLAATAPYQYLPGYNYAGKCDGFFTTLTAVNGVPAPSVYLDTVPAAVEFIACTAAVPGATTSIFTANVPKACWSVNVPLVNNTTHSYDPANEVTTYQEYIVLPLFLKQSLARRAKALNATYLQRITSYMFEEYKNCVTQGATSCHQGYRFPYSLAAAELAAQVSPAVQQLVLNDFFSTEQLSFIQSPGGLLGIDYMQDLAGMSKLHGNVPANVIRQHIQRFLELINLPEGMQLGFQSSFFEIQASGAMFGLRLSDFLSCTEQETIDFMKTQYNISTYYKANGVRGCANRNGMSVLIERNTSTENDVFSVVGGGDQINITVNSTAYRCPSGTAGTRVGEATRCAGSFSGTFSSAPNSSGPAQWQIALIVVAALLIAGGIAGLAAFLAKKYPPHLGARAGNALRPQVTKKSLQRYKLR